MAGNEILSSTELEKEMNTSDEEATYCILNDLKVTTGERTPLDVAKIILENRKNKLAYYDKNDPRIFNSKGKPRSKGDVVRYAGDIMDYMEIASLLERRMDGYFILKPNSLNDIKAFIEDKSYFNGYEQFYNVLNLKSNMLAPVEAEWFSYVDNLVDPEKFKTDIRSIIETSGIEVVFDDRITEIIESDKTTTKDIGNIGEAII